MKICLGKYLRAVHILSIIPALAKYSFAKKAESLSKTAKEAILNPKEKESVNEQSKNLPADDSELEGDLGTALPSGDVDEKIKHVNKDIMALPTPPSPPLNQVSSSPSQPSQVHPSHIQPPASASTAPKRQQLCK